MAWNTASVALGETTKKSHYDRLRQNDQAIASGSFTFYGLKTFNGSVKFNAGVTGTCTFRGKTKFTATAIFSKPVLLNNTDNTIAMLTIDSAALAANAIQTLAHGLGVRPPRRQNSLVCITAELGYTAGDEVDEIVQSPGDFRAINFVTDATNFYVITDNNALYMLRKDTNAMSTITMANWKARIRYGL